MSNEKFDNINIPKDIDKYIENGVESGLKERNRNKLKLHKNIIKIASISIISIGLLGYMRHGSVVFANINWLFYDIRSFLGIEKNLDDYKTVVNNSITKDGLTITLNEVILDGDNLIVSTIYQAENDIVDNGLISANVGVYINGKKKGYGSNGSSRQIDSRTVEKVINHDIEEVVEGDVDIKLVYSDIIYMENNKEKNIDEKFVFEFKSNGDELKIKTDSVKLNKKYELGTDETIVLNEYTSNDLGQKIIFSRDIHNRKFVHYDLKLVGKDNLGNDVQFSVRKTREDYGVFVFDNLDGNLDENAKSLTLSLYSAKQNDENGQLNTNYEKLGDEFIIELPN